MRRGSLHLFILSLLVFASCVPQLPTGSSSSSGSSSRRGSTSTNNTTNTTPTPVATINTQPLYWFDQGEIKSDLSLTPLSQTVVYLRGTEVERFLLAAGTTQKYCLVADFTGAAFNQLRLRVVPEFFNSEYRLRVDVPNTTSNAGECGDTSGLSTFSPSTLCPTCAGVLTATSFALYNTDGTNTTTLVGSTGPPDLELTGLILRFLPQSQAVIPTSCSDNSCQALNFDCCVQGQCVNNGQTKSSTNTTSTEYLIAEQEKLNNPLAYLNYPQLYHICTNSPVPTPTATSTVDQTQASQARLKALGEQYLCLVCDTTSGSDPSNSVCGAGGINLVYGENITFSACSYSTVQNTVVTQCGCQTNAANCPGYTLEMQQDSLSRATDFICLSPTPNLDPSPFQELTVQVPARSAPHRFFDQTTGLAVKDLSTASSNSNTPEGTEFFYLDPATKLIPQNGTFNMNSLTGQFSVALDQAQPAKLLDIEFDETYIISATSGFYTPCPTCGEDSWFGLFRSHPSSQMGRGIQPLGFTTSRHVGGTNISYANYEDNLFGRACFVPPTMLPFAHKGSATDVKTQRQERLQTQAAMYINGYQRDWFGFNKGALIGSFDGVKWFAIGKGRRVRAKSDKLFLAINAAYADLAGPSNLNVHVIKDQGLSVAADHGYDPELSWDHPMQTEAATCRQYHQCEADRDCISQLGWEYVCARTTSFKTLWPDFDTSGNEQQGDGSVISGIELLINGELPGDSVKRCVYRGRGAPCRLNPKDFTTEQNKRIYSCAPNFYCSALTQSVYNAEVARFAAPLPGLLQATNHYFGHDALQLGRPLSYVEGNQSLPSAVQTNLAYNAQTALAVSERFGTETGICLPGKDPTKTSIFDAQKSRDSSERTDYISQIGGCSSLYNHNDTTVNSLNSRFYGCPLIDGQGNYAHFNYQYENTVSDITTRYISSVTGQFDSNEGLRILRSQNSCGGESVHTSSVDPLDGSPLSAFKSVEAAPLSTIPSNIISPTMAKDACLRRAGSVCHTDLDCGPNRLHESLATTLTTQYFGLNSWEQKYWQESLICSQGTPEPQYTDSDYSTAVTEYDMTQNRCCREIGKDITLATQDENSNDSSTASLLTGTLSSKALTTNHRYSRYSVIPYLDVSTNPYNVLTQTAQYNDWNEKTLIQGKTKYPAPKVPALATNTLGAPYQWKTISETASKTCCGGGYIRQFADGTHDWTKTDRFQYDITQFRCLNYPNTMGETRPSNFATAADGSTGFPAQTEQWATQVDIACQEPSKDLGAGGCLQHEYAESAGEELFGPRDYLETDFDYSLSGIDTIGIEAYTEDNTTYTIQPVKSTLADPFSPYIPVDALNYPLAPDLLNLASHAGKPLVGRYQMKFFLPAYMNGIQNLAYIILERGCDSTPTCDIPCYCDLSLNAVPVSSAIAPTGVPQCVQNTPSGPNIGCNVTYDPVENTLVIFDGFNADGDASPSGFTMGYRTIGGNFSDGNDLFPVVNDDATTTNHVEYVSNDFTLAQSGFYQHRYTKPGNDLYYLTKLARFELTGIPQIYFEPLRCNDDRENLVPGFFNSSTWAAFMGSSDTFAINDATVNNMSDGLLKEGLTVDTADNVGNNNQDVHYLAGKNEVTIQPVFSGEVITCCTPLNREAKGSMDQCCSAYWVPTDGTSQANAASASAGTCKLPPGADLNLYFNPFVSGEYMRDDLDVQFLDTDFDPYTGEPLISTNSKLIQVGAKVCVNETTRYGGGFGNFNGKPVPRDGYFNVDSGDFTIYSLLDSFSDQDTTGYSGSFQFSRGYRWNQHIYCAD